MYSDSLTHSHSECDRCDEGNGFRKTGGYDVYYKQHNRYSFHQLVRCSYGISWLAEEPKQFNALQFQRSSCLLPGEESQRIFNLSDEIYETLLFGDHVVSYDLLGMPSPSLGMLMKICVAIETYLQDSTQNVAVIHCLVPLLPSSHS